MTGITDCYGFDRISAKLSVNMSIAIDSAMFRDDVTRVYCRIIGRPHTSQRIDTAYLLVNNTELQSTDIDGVDFQRYFQWEDNGIIPIELDYAPVSRADKAQVKLLTGEGIVLSPIVNLCDGNTVR
jgi:hypothetical protein